MEPELATYRDAVAGSLRRIFACLEGLDEDAVRWIPHSGANCLLVIANHSVENATRNVLSTFCGQAYDWQREREFAPGELTREGIAAAHSRFVAAMAAAFDGLEAGALSSPCEHGRLGVVQGRAVLLQAARHLGEHVGEAELTRGIWLSRGATV